MAALFVEPGRQIYVPDDSRFRYGSGRYLLWCYHQPGVDVEVEIWSGLNTDAFLNTGGKGSLRLA